MPGLTTISRRSFLIMTVATAAAACKPGTAVLKLTGATMGTTWNVVAVDRGRSVNERDLTGQIETALAEVTRSMSNWDAASELSQINAAAAGDALPLSGGMHRVLAAAAQVHEASQGAFDITSGGLIDLWGFGATGSAQRIPAEAEIAEALQTVGQGRLLAVGDATLTKSAAEARIYLSAIGKGHGVDRVAQVLREAGIEDFMVEIGGDLYTSGRNANGTPWQIGVEVPLAGASGIHRTLGVSGLGMATSGDYRNFFEHGGQRFSHIIDPVTGRPITHSTVSATVLAEDAMLADAWATAMLVLGRERGLAIAEAQGLAVLFIETGAEGLVTHSSSQLAALSA